MLRLVENKVAVRPIFDPEKSLGGIWIPDAAKERADQGIVKYVGPEVVDVKVGDYVLFSGYTGTLVILEGEGRVIILPEDFLIAIIETERLTTVSGLYFKDVDGEFFEATYEMAINICADTLTEKMETLKVKSKPPTKDEFDALKVRL